MLAQDSVLSAADLICLPFLQCCPDYLAMLCWFAPWYKGSTMHKKFLMKGVVKLIFPIKHCVLSATAMSFPQCFCRLELSEWKKGFKSLLTVCESCVRFAGLKKFGACLCCAPNVH